MLLGDVNVIDVRGLSEWEAGHIPGAPNIPVGHLTSRLDVVPSASPVAVHCQSGSRSSIAAGVLRSRGYTNVMNVTGGIVEWQKQKLPVESEIVAGVAV
jgi:hydroxyacylglutathione hydrolase